MNANVGALYANGNVVCECECKYGLRMRINYMWMWMVCIDFLYKPDMYVISYGLNCKN